MCNWPQPLGLGKLKMAGSWMSGQHPVQGPKSHWLLCPHPPHAHFEPEVVLSVNLPGLLAQLVHSFMLLLPVYVLGYLGLIFSWVLLVLGLLVWCHGEPRPQGQHPVLCTGDVGG